VNGESDELIAVMARLEVLLPRCGFGEDQVAWLAERRLAIEERSRPVADVRAELRQIISGMGSLLDRFIEDPHLRAERDRVADELHGLTAPKPPS
jgi:hypothetical protein